MLWNHGMSFISPPFFSGDFFLESTFPFSFSINDHRTWINKSHAPLITRVQDIVYTLVRRVCFPWYTYVFVFLFFSLHFLPDRLGLKNPLSFSTLRHCLSGRRTSIHTPSRRTCDRQDRDGRSAGCFVQGSLVYWKMRSVWVNGVGGWGRQRKKLAAKTNVYGRDHASEFKIAARQ